MEEYRKLIEPAIKQFEETMKKLEEGVERKQEELNTAILRQREAEKHSKDEAAIYTQKGRELTDEKNRVVKTYQNKIQELDHEKGIISSLKIDAENDKKRAKEIVKDAELERDLARQAKDKEKQKVKEWEDKIAMLKLDEDKIENRNKGLSDKEKQLNAREKNIIAEEERNADRDRNLSQREVDVATKEAKVKLAYKKANLETLENQVKQ